MYYTILSQVGNYFLGRGSVGELLLLKIGMDSIVRRKPFHSPSSYHPYFTTLSIFHNFIHISLPLRRVRVQAYSRQHRYGFPYSKYRETDFH